MSASFSMSDLWGDWVEKFLEPCLMHGAIFAFRFVKPAASWVSTSPRDWRFFLKEMNFYEEQLMSVWGKALNFIDPHSLKRSLQPSRNLLWLKIFHRPLVKSFEHLENDMMVNVFKRVNRDDFSSQFLHYLDPKLYSNVSSWLGKFDH